jgi:RNA polymerase primary sigma factor
MEMLFGINGYKVMTLQEVGDEVGLTREMVRQVKTKSLEILSQNKRFKLAFQS